MATENLYARLKIRLQQTFAYHNMPRRAQNFVRLQLITFFLFFPSGSLYSLRLRATNNSRNKKRKGESGKRCSLMKFCSSLGILTKLTLATLYLPIPSATYVKFSGNHLLPPGDASEAWDSQGIRITRSTSQIAT